MAQARVRRSAPMQAEDAAAELAPAGPPAGRPAPKEAKSAAVADAPDKEPVQLDAAEVAEKKKKKKKKKKKTDDGKADEESGDDDEEKADDKDQEDEKQKLIEVLRPNRICEESRRQANEREHKFWGTQPVPAMGEDAAPEAGSDGPIDVPKTVDDVRAEPLPLPAAFE